VSESFRARLVRAKLLLGVAPPKVGSIKTFKVGKGETLKVKVWMSLAVMNRPRR
jgi:hypothetical protein